MKELSIEEKAKAYDEALERAKEWFKPEEPDSYTCIVESIFPELKESEDEKMRAMAIKAVHAPEAQSCIKSWGINPDDVIAWLEKQGKQKPDKTFDSSKLKPDSNPYWTMAPEYQLANWKKSVWSEKDEHMLNTIANSLNREKVERVWNTTGEEAISWLKSLKERVLPQPKQEWSDKEIENCAREAEGLNCIILANHIRQLKYLKDRVLPQPKQEWSEEDEEMIEGLTNCLDELEKKNGWYYVYVNDKDIKLNKVREWLKSLKDRYLED